MHVQITLLPSAYMGPDMRAVLRCQAPCRQPASPQLPLTDVGNGSLTTPQIRCVMRLTVPPVQRPAQDAATCQQLTAEQHEEIILTVDMFAYISLSSIKRQ